MGLYTYDSTPIPKSDRIPKLVENLYAKMPEIESARAVLITESYKQTENEPMIIRRAKAFQHILENIPITIRDLELVVGSSTLAPRGCQTFPEFSYEWLEAEFDTVETRSADPFYISEQTKKELKEANAYWKGRTTSDLATAYMEPETLLDIEHNIFTPGNYFYNGVGHVTVKYGEVLEIGFSGIRKKAEDELASMKVSDGNYQTKSRFLEAVMISCDAAITYARRYAKLALEMAEKCSDPVRKNFLSLHRIVRMYRRRVRQDSMKHVSPSGLYSSCYRLSPVDIQYPLEDLISICILIIRRISTAARSQESLHRNCWIVSGLN